MFIDPVLYTYSPRVVLPPEDELLQLDWTIVKTDESVYAVIKVDPTTDYTLEAATSDEVYVALSTKEGLVAEAALPANTQVNLGRWRMPRKNIVVFEAPRHVLTRTATISR